MVELGGARFLSLARSSSSSLSSPARGLVVVVWAGELQLRKPDSKLGSRAKTLLIIGTVNEKFQKI